MILHPPLQAHLSVIFLDHVLGEARGGHARRQTWRRLFQPSCKPHQKIKSSSNAVCPAQARTPVFPLTVQTSKAKSSPRPAEPAPQAALLLDEIYDLFNM